MTVEEARRTLENYRKVDKKTGKVYIDGLEVYKHIGFNQFECRIKNSDDTRLRVFAVLEDGHVLPAPVD